GSEEHPIWQKLAFWQEVKQPTEKNWELRGNDSLPTGAYLGSRTAQPLVLQTNQVMRLYIDGEANKMGLFTSTPQAALHIEATDALVVPVGTTGQRPGQPVVGMIRFNKTLGKLEGYTKQGWKPLH
ncbi:MAG TPA: hypothetical protein PKD90_05585, partial [Phnomibacter sp.]|nr:hypothetical protein [Phnomibacter sp.]